MHYFTSRRWGGITQEKDLKNRWSFYFRYTNIYTIQKSANFIGVSPKDLNYIFQVVPWHFHVHVYNEFIQLVLCHSIQMLQYDHWWKTWSMEFFINFFRILWPRNVLSSSIFCCFSLASVAGAGYGSEFWIFIQQFDYLLARTDLQYHWKVDCR